MTINRRHFLSTIAPATTGALMLSGLGWPESRAAAKLQKIGLQLYTVRNEMAKDFEGTLRKVAELGYLEVEFAGYYNRSPQDVKTILARLALSAPAAHVPLAEVQTNIDKNIETARVIGHKLLVCPYLVDKDRKSLDDYKRHAETFNKAGEACQKAGLQFAYHNHDFEFIELDGQLPYDLLLAQTDKNLVKMELDLYWITKAGKDPLAYLAKDPARYVTFHVKDMDKTEKKDITEVGHGSIDFKTIFAKSKGRIKHYFVEQDRCPGSPFDSIKFSIDYLKQLAF